MTSGVTPPGVRSDLPQPGLALVGLEEPLKRGFEDPGTLIRASRQVFNLWGLLREVSIELSQMVNS